MWTRLVVQLRQVILDEVRAAQLRHSSPPPQPVEAAATTTLSGHFTPAITSLLQSAYDARKSATGPLNKGEKRELARATGLTEKQVITWFGNARQREKKRHDREASSGGSGSAAATKRSSVRAVPYSLDMAPQYRRKLSAEQRYPSTMRPPHQQQQEDRRTWSLGSSTLSSSRSFESSTSSLDLVEYASTEPNHDAAPASSTFVLPAPAPAPAPKIQLDVSAALDPSGWFSMAASTPSPPPPTMLVEAPHELEEGPFLSLPAPTPEVADQLLPAGSSPVPPSSWSAAAAISPTPSFEMPSTALVADEPLPYVPAPTDAWMDDEFYRNLFSSLGFEMEVGIGVDGFLGGNGGPAGASSGGGAMGGLTLRMDVLQRM